MTTTIETPIELPANKAAFVSIARAVFAPDQRDVCAVCGKYKSLTHAHHVVPLTLQFDRGFEAPNSKHVWLCPTHHAAVHLLIGQAKSKQERASAACISLVSELDKEELSRVLEIAEAAWQ